MPQKQIKQKNKEIQQLNKISVCFQLVHSLLAQQTLYTHSFALASPLLLAVCMYVCEELSLASGANSNWHRAGEERVERQKSPLRTGF